MQNQYIISMKISDKKFIRPVRSLMLKQNPFKLIDLTHSLSPEIPGWDIGCGFEHHLHHDYDPKSVSISYP